jgi:flagellar motor component MotA
MLLPLGKLLLRTKLEHWKSRVSNTLECGYLYYNIFTVVIFYRNLFSNIKNIVTHNWANFVTESPKLFHKIFSYISKKLEDNLANFYKEIAMESVEMSTSKLYEDYEHLFTEKLFADVELIVDGKQIKAHKAILSSELIILVTNFMACLYIQNFHSSFNGFQSHV